MLSFGQELVLEGTFQGKNVFVQNPYSSDGVGFCVQKVEVNGAEVSSKIDASAFEIDLMALGLKEGDEVSIRIVHKSDCLPKILNTNFNSRPNLKYKNVEIVPKE